MKRNGDTLVYLKVIKTILESGGNFSLSERANG